MLDVSDGAASVSGAASSSAVSDWSLRSPAANDALLRESFLRVLAESRDSPPEQKLVMYDACDAGAVEQALGPFLRKRLDARRNTKPKKPNEQLFVCTPFNPDGFHFGKISNEKERLLKLNLADRGGGC